MLAKLACSLTTSLAALMTFSAAAAAVPALLVSTPEGIRPVAIYDGGKFFAPSSNRERQELLGKDLIDRSRELPLFYNGENFTYFHLESFEATPARCSGAGLWRGRTDKSNMRPMLAFSQDFPGPRRYVGSLPATTFSSIATQMSKAGFQRKRVPASALAKFKVRRVEPFTLMNGTRVMVAVEADIFSPARSCPDYHQLLIIEKVGRRWQTQLEHFRHNTVNDCASYQLLGSFGTDNQIDSLAIQGSSLDARWYDLYQTKAFGGLTRIFHGGGHSCLR